MNLEQLYRQAVRSHQNGNLAEAERLYLELLAAEPVNFALRHMLGVLRAQQGRNAEALELLGTALELNPRAASAWVNFGNVLGALGRPEEALAAYDKALAIKPHDTEALYNRGSTLRDLKRFEEALASYDKVLTLRPRDVEVLIGRGIILSELERPEQALASHQAALAVEPRNVTALYNRGNALYDLHLPDEALASYDRALSIDPRLVAALYNRGNALRDLGRHEDALASYDAALAISPDLVEALNNRGLCLQLLKRFDAAMASYRRVLALDPAHRHALSGVAYSALSLCDWTAKIADDVKTQAASGAAIISPLILLGCSSDPALQLRCARRYIEDRMPSPQRPLWDGTVYRHDKIRLAYASSDFRDHPVAVLAAELFECHDRARFEVTAMSFGPDDGSAMRARIVKAFDRFHDVRGQDEQEIARLLRHGEVDIVVDLNGHTLNARTGIFARRPCPVQVNYLGYPGTMGADFVDYVLADPIVAPMDLQPFFSEKIVHLTDCYQANDSTRTIAARTPARAQAHLPDEAFVFCCFNASWKITAPLFDIWMRLLAAVPGSVLWLLEDNEGATANLRGQAGERGIDPVRLVFAPRMAAPEHLARHRQADLFLDTLPYNAHTTASDALWAGLPLVTCQGESFASRVAASLLRAAGLPELVTESLQDYETLALKLARDARSLRALRDRLEQNRRSCALFDTARFCRTIESAYTTMWDIWQRGEAPRGFSVAPPATCMG